MAAPINLEKTQRAHSLIQQVVKEVSWEVKGWSMKELMKGPPKGVDPVVLQKMTGFNS